MRRSTRKNKKKHQLLRYPKSSQSKAGLAGLAAKRHPVSSCGCSQAGGANDTIEESAINQQPVSNNLQPKQPNITKNTNATTSTNINQNKSYNEFNRSNSKNHLNLPVN